MAIGADFTEEQAHSAICVLHVQILVMFEVICVVNIIHQREKVLLLLVGVLDYIKFVNNYTKHIKHHTYGLKILYPLLPLFFFPQCLSCLCYVYVYVCVISV